MMKDLLWKFAAPVIDSGDAGIPSQDADRLLQNILNIVWFTMGMVAVIMIIIGAYQYLTSNGEPAKTSKAMQTILYSVIGLVVAIAAFAITGFILGSF